MNKYCYPKVLSLVFVFSFALLPTDALAGLEHDIAKAAQTQIKMGQERSKWLEEFNKTYLNPFGLYETINSLPSKFSNLLPENNFIREAAKIAVKTPLKFYFTKHVCSQNFLYILETFLSQKVLDGMPKSIAGSINQTPDFIAEIASDYSMGEVSSVTGLVYDNLIKDIVKSYIRSAFGEIYADLGSAYAKAIIRSLFDPYQEALEQQAMYKIKELANSSAENVH